MNFFTHRRRGFTFIELIVAVALSIILIRGMFTMFHSATRLTALSDERMQVLLESSAVYEYLATDLTRAVTGEGFYFQAAADGSSIIFRAMPISTASDVYIRYQISGNKLQRSVLAAPSGAAVDDDGDGHNDVDMVVGMNIKAFDVKCHAAGAINDGAGGIGGTWGSGGIWDPNDETSVAPKAVKFVINFLNPIADPNAVAGTGLPEEEYTMIIPVMPQ
jgi:prepilin-type N-terminal cleavage/methylation domain-containing protein